LVRSRCANVHRPVHGQGSQWGCSRRGSSNNRFRNIINRQEWHGEFKAIEGTYTYQVEKQGFYPVRGQVSVEEDVKVEVTMVEPFTVYFLVKREDGLVINEAIVNYDEESKITGENGIAEFKAIMGTYAYKVKKEAYIPFESLVTVEGDTTVLVTLLMDTYVITFNVKDEEDNPIEEPQSHSTITCQPSQTGMALPGLELLKGLTAAWSRRNNIPLLPLTSMLGTKTSRLTSK
jgi:hypothetical protein